MVTIERLTALRDTKDATLERFSGLLSEIDNPAVLLFALLFHDVGKGAHTGEHSRVSVDLAKQAMARIAGATSRATMTYSTSP